MKTKIKNPSINSLLKHRIIHISIIFDMHHHRTNKSHTKQPTAMVPRIAKQIVLSALLLASTSFSDALSVASSSNARATRISYLSATVSTQDDILKPPYEVEPIPIRIGHGFDIHRMAPIEVAGQPLVIGGVEITHSDQKVGPSMAGNDFPCRIITHEAFFFFIASGQTLKVSASKRGVFMKPN